jgi:hypothetical protein
VENRSAILLAVVLTCIFARVSAAAWRLLRCARLAGLAVVPEP